MAFIYYEHVYFLTLSSSPKIVRGRRAGRGGYGRAEGGIGTREGGGEREGKGELMAGLNKFGRSHAQGN